jgi:hypothetical protein
MAAPDPSLMIKYCGEVLPGTLTDACDVPADLAERIGEDVLARAEAFALLPQQEQEVLVAPFVEEVFDHEPLDASLGLKAMVTVVVRNSLLEEAHHDGPLDSGLIAVTQYAAGPLSHFLASRRREPVDYQGSNPFHGLSVQYPRAWACLTALTEVFSVGGRQPVRFPEAPVPSLPTGDELVTAPRSSGDSSAAVFSAIDPRFDQDLLGLLERAAGGDDAVYLRVESLFPR